MKYRLALPADGQRIVDYCVRKGIAAPFPRTAIILAEDEYTGDIIGIIGLRNIPLIEPFISDNPLVTNNLYRMAEGILINQQQIDAFGFCDKDKEPLFNKFGFETIESEKIIMRKRW